MIKNKIGYFFILIFFGLFAILYDEYFTGILLLAMLLLPVVLLIICILTLAGVSADINSPSLLASKGEEFLVTVKLTNKSIFPISKMNITFSYYNDFAKIKKKERLLISMDRNCSQEVSTYISSSYCGNIIVELKAIKIYDFIHIWSLKKRSKGKLIIPVLPDCHIANEDIIKENKSMELESEEYSPYKSGDDPSEVFQIREYREGDKPHRIHWKLSYKEDQLMIKEFSDPLNTNIVMAVDFYGEEILHNPLEFMDSILECVMSISFSLSEYRHKFHITWWEEEEKENLYSIDNDNDIYTVIDTLFQFSPKRKQPGILPKLAGNLSMNQYSHFIYVTAKLSMEEIVQLAQTMKTTILIVYYINKGEIPVQEEMKRIFETLSITFYEIDVRNIEGSFLSA